MLGWALVWLAGVGAITGFSVTRHAPALERVMLESVQDALASLDVGDASFAVSVRDHEATLSGTVESAAQRDALLAAAATGSGIRRVVDHLEVRTTEESAPMDRPPEAPAPREPMASEESADGPASEEVAALLSPSGQSSSGARALAEPPQGGVPPEEGAPEPASEEPIPGEPMSGDLSLEGRPLADAASVEPSLTESSSDAPPIDATPATAPPIEGATTRDAPAEPRSDELEAGPSTDASPTLRLGLTDRTLTIEGRLSEEDDTAALVDAAIDGFEVDYISSIIDNDANTASAEWLEPLADLLPDLSALEAPGIDVVDRQVTLYGTAPDESTRDSVLEAALERLGDYSLVELVEVSSADPKEAAEGPDPTNAANTSAGADPENTTDPIEATTLAEVSESAERAVPTETPESTEETALTEAPEPTEAMALTEAPEPTEATAPTEAPEPTEATAPTEAPEQTEATAPTEAPEPTEETALTEAPEPTEETALTEAPEPTEATAPTGALEQTEAPTPIEAPKPTDEAALTEAPRPTEATDADGRTAAEDTTVAAGSPEIPPVERPLETALLAPPPTRPPESTKGPEALRAAFATLPDTKILFESASDKLTAPSRRKLDDIAAVLRRYSPVPVTIEGHTDGEGPRENNLRLSRLRAVAVRDHLLTRGVTRDRLTAYGYGEAVPLADNATPEGRAANRRIEFIF